LRWISSTKSFKLATTQSSNLNKISLGKRGRSVHLRMGYTYEEVERRVEIRRRNGYQWSRRTEEETMDNT